MFTEFKSFNKTCIKFFLYYNYLYFVKDNKQIVIKHTESLKIFTFL